MEYSKESLITTLKELESESQDLTGLAIAFVLQHKQVASILAGASSAEQIEDTVNAYNESIPAERLDTINTLLKEDLYKDQRI